MTHPAVPSATLPIPPLIKRNTALFALSQSFNGAGRQFAYALGPLMVLGLTASPGLAGLSVGLIGLSRFLVAYPVGKIMDAFGRKPAILVGLALALAGTIALGLSVTDALAIPNWIWHRHVNHSRTEPAILFSLSDFPMLKPFGFYRDETRD